MVSVGDEVVVRWPGSAEVGAPKWQLTSFDSVMLRRTQPLQLTRTSGGTGFEWSARFVALRAGSTELVVTRTNVSPDAPGDPGERMRFQIVIR